MSVTSRRIGPQQRNIPLANPYRYLALTILEKALSDLEGLGIPVPAWYEKDWLESPGPNDAAARDALEFFADDYALTLWCDMADISVATLLNEVRARMRNAGQKH